MYITTQPIISRKSKCTICSPFLTFSHHETFVLHVGLPGCDSPADTPSYPKSDDLVKHDNHIHILIFRNGKISKFWWFTVAIASSILDSCTHLVYLFRITRTPSTKWWQKHTYERQRYCLWPFTFLSANSSPSLPQGANVTAANTLIRSDTCRKRHQWDDLDPWIQHLVIRTFVTTQWTRTLHHFIPPLTVEHKLRDHGASHGLLTIIRIKEVYAWL